MRTFIITFILSVILLGCSGVVKHDFPAVLKMEVIQIPSQGKVSAVSGDAELKKAEINGYSKVGVGTIIGENDILWLKKGCIARIEFEDGTSIINEKQDKDAYFTFKILRIKAMPQT